MKTRHVFKQEIGAEFSTRWHLPTSDVITSRPEQSSRSCECILITSACDAGLHFRDAVANRLSNKLRIAPKPQRTPGIRLPAATEDALFGRYSGAIQALLRVGHQYILAGQARHKYTYRRDRQAIVHTRPTPKGMSCISHYQPHGFFSLSSCPMHVPMEGGL